MSAINRRFFLKSAALGGVLGAGYGAATDPPGNNPPPPQAANNFFAEETAPPPDSPDIMEKAGRVVTCAATGAVAMPVAATALVVAGHVINSAPAGGESQTQKEFRRRKDAIDRNRRP